MPTTGLSASFRQKRGVRILLLILSVAVTVDKIWISRQWPGVSGLVTVNPMPVFLDIPADLYLTFGLLPVLAVFILLYSILLLVTASHKDGKRRQNWVPGLWNAVTALFILPFWMLTGSLFYWLIRDHLSKQVRNGIASFGITADIHTFLPGYEVIHLQGTMIMLVFLFPGLYFFIRKMKRPVAAPPLIIAPARTAPVKPRPAGIHIQYPGGM